MKLTAGQERVFTDVARAIVRSGNEAEALLVLEFTIALVLMTLAGVKGRDARHAVEMLDVMTDHTAQRILEAAK